MAFLAKTRKCDELAHELGEEVDTTFTIVKLRKAILNSIEYEEELAKSILEGIVEKRERQEGLEKQEKDRQFELEKLKLQAFSKTTSLASENIEVYSGNISEGRDEGEPSPSKRILDVLFTTDKNKSNADSKSEETHVMGKHDNITEDKGQNSEQITEHLKIQNEAEVKRENLVNKTTDHKSSQKQSLKELENSESETAKSSIPSLGHSIQNSLFRSKLDSRKNDYDGKSSDTFDAKLRQGERNARFLESAVRFPHGPLKKRTPRCDYRTHAIRASECLRCHVNSPFLKEEKHAAESIDEKPGRLRENKSVHHTKMKKHKEKNRHDFRVHHGETEFKSQSKLSNQKLSVKDDDSIQSQHCSMPG